MEQIETQATDLRYLIQVPAPPALAPVNSSGGVGGNSSDNGNGNGNSNSLGLPQPQPPIAAYPRRLGSVSDDQPHTVLSPHQLSSIPASSRQPLPSLPLLHPTDGAATSSSTPLPSPFSPDGTQGGRFTRAETSGLGPSGDVMASSTSPASHAGVSATPSGKRKPEDDENGPKQQRSKRNRVRCCVAVFSDCVWCFPC